LKARITVPTVVFAGLDDLRPFPTPPRRGSSTGPDHCSSGRIFKGDYIIEQVPGGHFMHREHPEVFAERLLAHL
jgi:pimeloyl-ACP methyl ester carboxylesterase